MLDVIAANGKRGKDAAPISPIAFEVVKRMGALFEIERDVNGLPPTNDCNDASRPADRRGGPSGQNCPEAPSQRFST
ncbi:hypothetical protein BQ8794_50069 [Mesorhizobium prunaredense]|uniref:Uncharacterized protein n=1 Tax=Mesorhizobium prunaredense TaxID=1631249 RepID=A0A1R3VHS2_9HYPH|nr:hypothetical protein BQ8794_50069 [Mesorhizobium prunaredense]